MNGKLILGVLLFGSGLILAGIGIIGIGTGSPSLVASGSASAEFANRLNSYAIPVMSGLLLAGGAILIGLSLGNWTHPRTKLEPGDAVVNPEGYRKMKHV